MNRKKPSSTHRPGPEAQSVRAEDVDWKDAMKHALDTPKPEDSEKDQPQDDDQAEPAAD